VRWARARASSSLHCKGEAAQDCLVPISKEKLTPAQFSELADVPPELEWHGNFTNEKIERAYKNDVAEFMLFSGLFDQILQMAFRKR
jgi:hypothetical protein